MHLKNFLSFLLLAVCFLAANADYPGMFDIYPGYAGAYYVLSEEERTAEFMSLDPYVGGDLVFPTHVTINDKQYRIASIGENAFKDSYKNWVISVTLPDSLTEIKKKAFNACEDLKSVIFPNTLKNIGDSAFYKCATLDSIGLPKSLKEIGDYAFSRCNALSNIMIPDSVTKIGRKCFAYCENIENIVIGKGVTDSGHLSFLDDYNIHTVYTFATVPPYQWGYTFGTFWPDIHSPSPTYLYTSLYAPEESMDKYKEVYSPTHTEYNFLKFYYHYPLPDFFAMFSKEKYTVKQGEEVRLPYRIFNPGNVEIIQAEWESFNPNAVAVENGVAKGLRAGETTHVSITFTDASGNKYVSECRVEVEHLSKVDSTESSESDFREIFSLNGIKLGNSIEGLAPGIYIEKQGKNSRKIVVR